MKRLILMLLALLLFASSVLAAPQDVGQGSGEITDDSPGGETVLPPVTDPDLEPKPEVKPEPEPTPDPDPTPDPEPEYPSYPDYDIPVTPSVPEVPAEPEVEAPEPVPETPQVDDWPVYADMKPDRSDWYYTYVRDLAIAGVVGGYPDGSYRPQGQVTWGEALKLILLACGYEVQTPTAAHWASGYEAIARRDGLIPAGDIELDTPITRLAYAQIAAKGMKLGLSAVASPFADSDSAAVLALYEAGIIEGSFDEAGNRVFLPNNSITRAEMAAVVWRIRNFRAE